MTNQQPSAPSPASSDQVEGVRREEIELEDGTWTVTIKDGEHLQITDAQGRNRHRSIGHMMTGVHFAMTLAKQTFESSEYLDRMLQATAKKFIEQATEPEGKEQP